jgi:hypothetical protein
MKSTLLMLSLLLCLQGQGQQSNEAAPSSLQHYVGLMQGFHGRQYFFRDGTLRNSPTSMGVHLQLLYGYKFNRHFALESGLLYRHANFTQWYSQTMGNYLQYHTRLNTFQVPLDLRYHTSGTKLRFTSSINVATLSLIQQRQQNSQFGPNVTLLSELNTSSSNLRVDVASRITLGGEYQIDPHWLIRAEILVPRANPSSTPIRDWTYTPGFQLGITRSLGNSR